MLSLKTSLLGLLAATSVVYAQTPAYIGQLLIKPGISNTKCLTPAADADGAAVSIQDCTGAANQKWTFTGGQIRIFANKCLDVTGGVNADGTKLQVWTCVANSANQKFSYSFWDFRITWNNAGKCVDLAKGATANGTPAQIWTCGGFSINRIWNTGYLYNQIPAKTQNGQTGTSACGTGNSQTSQCQTAVINSATDFCLYGPPSPNSQIGDIERIAVAYCTKPGRGTRLIPNGTLKGVHFVKTPEYVQVTGAGDFTKINIRAGDSGGEMDPHGADGNGNPIGGLVYGNTFGTNVQYHEWTTFQSSNEFCFRACVGARAKALCQHIYDVMGCWWNMPANYDAGYFENCDGNPATPMGVYGTSTWFQGVSPTPAAHPAPASSNCVRVPSVTSTPTAVAKRGLEGRWARAAAPTLL